MLLLITVQLKYFQLFFLQKWYFITIITAAFKLVSDIIKALVCQLGRQTQKFWLRCQIRPLCWVFLLLPVCKKRGAPGFHTRPTAVLMCNYRTMFTSDNRQMLHSYFSRHIYGLSASAALAFKFLQSGFNVVQSKLELNGHKSSLIVMWCFYTATVTLTLDSSLSTHGRDSGFFTKLSDESSRLFIVLYFLIIKLSTTQNMIDYRGRQRHHKVVRPKQSKTVLISFTFSSWKQNLHWLWRAR